MRIFLLLIGLLIPGASAQDFASQGPGVSDMWAMICSTLPFCNVGTGAPALVADRGMALIMPLVTGVAVCSALYAGIQLMMGQGNSDGVGKAKKTLFYAIAGMVLMLIVTSIFRFVVLAVTWFS